MYCRKNVSLILRRRVDLLVLPLVDSGRAPYGEQFLPAHPALLLWVSCSRIQSTMSGTAWCDNIADSIRTSIDSRKRCIVPHGRVHERAPCITARAQCRLQDARAG